MPKAVPVTFEGYLKVLHNLEPFGFREATEKERILILAQMDKEEKDSLAPQRYTSRGGESCVIFTGKKYAVVIWTSCLLREIRKSRLEMEDHSPEDMPFHMARIVSRPPNEDAARVLILSLAENGFGKGKYFARDVNRTKGFVTNLSRRAWVTWYKVTHPPKCEKCGAEMDIRRNAAGGTFWACYNNEHKDDQGKVDGKPFFRDWHYGLPPKALKVVKGWDRAYATQLRKIRQKRKQEGKQPPERKFQIKIRAKAKRRLAA